MKFISIYFFDATLMHTLFFRLPYFAGGNKQFLAKSVIFFKSTKMCLVCAYQKFFLSQTKVCYHVIIRCYYHCLDVFSLEAILTQNLKRSDFCPGTSFDPRIIYAFIFESFVFVFVLFMEKVFCVQKQGNKTCVSFLQLTP